MNKPKDEKLPSHFVLTAYLSSGLTLGMSGVYLLLSIAAIVFRFNCETGSTDGLQGRNYFWHTIFRVYILKNEDCAYTVTIPPNITTEFTVFVLTVLTLCISVLCIVSAIMLIIAVQDDSFSRYMYVIVFSYMGCYVASLIVDLTTASHFGMDYEHLSSGFDPTYGSSTSYEREVIRQGALMLMSISLKGYVAHSIGIVLQILLIVYFLNYKKQLKNNGHPIHKLGALNAYDQPRKPDEWSQSDQFSPYTRGPLANNAFLHDDEPPRHTRLEPQRFNDYPNRPIDRTESWRDQNLSQSSRPFSYLEDVKRPSPRPPPSPAVESPWRQNAPVESPWRRDAPHVPAPDYSPTTPRRLKSALKPGYM